jgi:RimJ/RimL family protein N-acetyltransferase
MGEPGSRDNAVLVRPAVGADSELLLAWRNDPEVRARSRSSEPIDRAAHGEWLRRSLITPTRHILVVQSVEDGRPIGTTRYDLLDESDLERPRAHWEISIAIAPEVRGRGFGQATLAASDAWLVDAEPTVAEILAWVRPDNVGSRRLFERNGYRGTRSTQPGLECFVRRFVPMAG